MDEREKLIDCLASDIAGFSKERRDKFLVLFRKHQRPEFVEHVLNLARKKWREKKDDKT